MRDASCAGSCGKLAPPSGSSERRDVLEPLPGQRRLDRLEQRRRRRRRPAPRCATTGRSPSPRASRAPARAPRRAAGRSCSRPGAAASRPGPGPPGSPRRRRSAARRAGSAASTTCSSRSASASSSSVARKACARSFGRSRMKPDRVGDDDLALAREAQPARRRVERGEQLVLGQHVAAGERVEQRGLAGVGVADDGDHRQPRARRARARRPAALLAEAVDLALERGDALARAAAVDLELRLAGAAPADAAGQARQRRRSSRAGAAAGSCSCASSTCSLPSRLWARCAKMSRISCVRSMTLRSVKSGDRVRLDRASGRGRRSARRRRAACARIRTSSSLPRPIRYFGSASGRRCSRTPITRTPAVRHSSSQLVDARPPELARGRRARPARRAAAAGRRPRPAARGRACRSTIDRGRDALELLLERGDQRRRSRACCGRTARSAAGARAARRSIGGSRWATCRSAGRPVGPDADRRDQVQPQQRQVDEVVARQRLVAQVRVHQAQAAEAPPAGAEAADVGQVDARGVAHDHVLDLAAPADQQPDLALDLARHPAQVRRQLGRRDLGGAEPPPVDALQRCFWLGLSPVIFPLTTCGGRG